MEKMQVWGINVKTNQKDMVYLLEIYPWENFLTDFQREVAENPAGAEKMQKTAKIDVFKMKYNFINLWGADPLH